MQGEHAPALMDALEAASQVLSPQLTQAELGNALWKFVRWQEMPLEEALQHFSTATDLIDELLQDASLMPQALRLTEEHAHPVYDMLYIAAALQHGAKLLTVDQKLKKMAAKISQSLVVRR